METHYVVYDASTGEAVSIGSVLANPLPDGLTTYELSAEEAELIYSGQIMWDSTTLQVVPITEQPTCS